MDLRILTVKSGCKHNNMHPPTGSMQPKWIKGTAYLDAVRIPTNSDQQRLSLQQSQACATDTPCSTDYPGTPMMGRSYTALELRAYP